MEGGHFTWTCKWKCLQKSGLSQKKAGMWRGVILHGHVAGRVYRKVVLVKRKLACGGGSFYMDMSLEEFAEKWS